MKDSIFDLVETEIPEGKEGFFELAARAPQPKDKSFLNDIKDYGKTILKGTLEGVSKLGSLMSPLAGVDYQKEHENLTENLNELLPTDEGYTQKALRRGLKEAPSVMANPFGSALATLPRAIASGFLGEAAKDLGAPEWAQTAAELTAYIGPDILKKALASGSNNPIIEAARKLGMSDEAITPLIQSEFKQKWLSKLAPKRGSTQKALEKSKGELSTAYESLGKRIEAGVEVSEKVNGHLINDLKRAMNEMPHEMQGKISEDLKDLLGNKITPNALMNFYKDVNAVLGGKTKQISLLKEPIKKAIRSVSPELGKDFELVNDLYSKYSTISARLKPNLTSDIISAAETLGLTGSVYFGDYPTLIGILGEKSGKKLAQQMLINPRFQQLSKKMIVAINENRFALAKKTTDEMNKEILKFIPESSGQLKELTKEDFESFFNPKGKVGQPKE